MAVRQTKRLKRIMKQLNVPTPEDVAARFDDEGELVAEQVRLALQNVINSIRKKSVSGALSGYTAVKERVNKEKSIKLKRSGLTIKGKFEWIVFVQAPAETGNFNLFDTLDKGRKRLPKSSTPYPLWGVRHKPEGATGKNKRYPSNVRISHHPGRLTVGETPAVYPDGAAPHRFSVVKARRIPVKSDQYKAMRWTFGPISKVPAAFLYDAARRRAIDQLTIKGLNRRWDLVEIGRKA